MNESQDEAKILESLNRFIQHAQSTDVYTRNLVGSKALETLQMVASSPQDVSTVLELLTTVASDSDVEVRCYVLEYIVHIALFLSDPNKSCETLRSFITSHILPIIVTALLDADQNVVKLADSSLIALLEHCLVPNGYVQERIWPAIIKKMYDHPLTDSIVRVITLMSKMVPWVGCDTTETLFIPLFVQLCSYPDIAPRKACASIIGDFCAVVSLATVENKLVPSFLTLCSDSTWIVRKACAVVFTSVSSAASTCTRRQHLAPAFAALLTDPLHYVRSAAFESLGPFITTFAEPSITNLEYNHQGKLVLRHPDGFEFLLSTNIDLNVTERYSLSSSTGENNLGWQGIDFADKVENESEDDIELLECDQNKKISTLKNIDMTTSCEDLLNKEADNMSEEEKLELDSTLEKHLDDNGWKSCDKNDNKHKEETASNESLDDFNCSNNESELSKEEHIETGYLIDSDGEFLKEMDNNVKVEELEHKESSSDEMVDSVNESNNPHVSPAQLQSSVEEKHVDPTLTKEVSDCDESVSDTAKIANFGKPNESFSVENDFNGFVFWRDPIPDIEIDLNLESKRRATDSATDHLSNRLLKDRLLKIIQKHPTATNSSERKKRIQRRFSKSDSPGKSSDSAERIKSYDKSSQTLFVALLQQCEASKRFVDGNGNNCNENRTASVVPDELINHFVSMSSPRQDKQLDELAHHCAYNLPAVALTLGPENWALIKQACNSLATDQRWRVRKIVASSIHELAVIVGSEVATKDLVPVFTGFIKDLDEVRIGALKHLANFLKLLKPTGRNSFLPRFAEFLITDYEWNWRFRAELAEQLLQIVRMFTAQDVSVHLAPVVFTLLQDKVAHVRIIAVELVVEVVSIISKEGVLVRSAVAELAEQFAHSSRWSRRQTFAHLCSRLVEEEAIPVDMFARDILPHLLDLSWDKVPNVRLSVARTLSHHIMALDTFSNPCSPHHEIVMIVLKRLQGDKDRDVRFFAYFPPQPPDTFYTAAQLPESSTFNTSREAQDGSPR